MANNWCPRIANVTTIISIFLSLSIICLSYIFWKNRDAAAFKIRQPIITVIISIASVIAMILPVAATYNICNKGEIQTSLYFNVTAAGIYLYCLWLITFRSWILFLNWKV